MYPCPNLESLHIEKPTNDIFNIDAQNVPFLYGNTVPFVNLKVSRYDFWRIIRFKLYKRKENNFYPTAFCGPFEDAVVEGKDFQGVDDGV